MTADELIRHAKALQGRIARYGGDSSRGPKAEVVEFLRVYAGPKSAFASQAAKVEGHRDYELQALHSILESFAEFVGAGLAQGVSPEVRAQIDVVSDILGQAYLLLENPKVHSAAPIVLIGASLEEFLRTWTEREILALGNAKPGLDAYAKLLREADLITKQDIKDITSWSGLRNHAAHGEWDLVQNREQANLMLQGVNLFMRRYAPGG